MSKVHGHADVDECQIGGGAQVPDVDVKRSATNGLEDCAVGWKAGIVDDCTGIIVPAADCPVRRIP